MNKNICVQYIKAFKDKGLRILRSKHPIIIVQTYKVTFLYIDFHYITKLKGQQPKVPWSTFRNISGANGGKEHRPSSPTCFEFIA